MTRRGEQGLRRSAHLEVLDSWFELEQEVAILGVVARCEQVVAREAADGILGFPEQQPHARIKTSLIAIHRGLCGQGVGRITQIVAGDFPRAGAAT